MRQNGVGWADEPMRWSQLTLSERDAATIDVDFWLDYFQTIRSDGVCLSAGGYVAYYPTDVPYHHRSRWLGERDPFGELVEGCRRQGMAVLARTDPHAVHEDAFRAHPEWVQRGPDGQARPHWSMAGAWLTCMLGAYNFEVMTVIHREIASRYDVQGIFTNRWRNIGVCYCDDCRARFFGETGLGLPEPGGKDDDLRRLYLGWQQERYFDLVRIWGDAIGAVNPRARIVPNAGLSRCPPEGTVDLDLSRLAGGVDILFADHQGRQGEQAPWHSGLCAKTFASVSAGRPVGAIFSVGLEGKHRWKDSVQSVAELRIWVAESVAHGMRPWWTKFGATVPDGRWLGAVKDLYQQYAEWEGYLRNTGSLATVALVYTQRAGMARLPGQSCGDLEDHLAGMYQALVEARIPFDMLGDSQLPSCDLARFDAVILPNIAMLSDAECRVLEEFVEGGGGLVATHTTSLFDERGGRREGLGLGALFGVGKVGPVEGPMQNSYLSLAQEGAPEALAGIESTTRVINGVSRLPVEMTVAADLAPLRLVASYPDLPMEEVYVRDTEPGPPQLILGDRGAGRVAYFPFDIDRTFWEVLHPDHGRLLSNAVRWASRRPFPVEVSGRGLIDVSAWSQAGSLTVHLVNLTNPMTMRGYYRELLPVGPLRVVLKSPSIGAKGARSVRLLRARRSADFQVEGSMVEIEVPEVADHEVVAVDLGD